MDLPTRRTVLFARNGRIRVAQNGLARTDSMLDYGQRGFPTASAAGLWTAWLAGDRMQNSWTDEVKHNDPLQATQRHETLTMHNLL